MIVKSLVMREFKGVRHVEIRDPGLKVEISGPNGSGKSSVLEGIVAAIGGKKAIIAKPLRDGAEKGEIVLRTEELEITRRFTDGGATTLTVKGIGERSGFRYGQERLNEIFNLFSFDPLAFSRMKVAEQVTVLEQLAGPEFCQQLAALDAEAEEVFTARTDLNREIKALGDPPPVDAVEEIDASALLAELDEANKFNAAQRDRERERKDLADEIARTRQRVIETQALLKQLQGSLAEWEPQLAALPAPEAPRPTDEIAARLAGATAANKKALAYQEYTRKQAEKQEKQALSEQLTARLTELRDKRQQLAKNAALGVDGVEFSLSGIRVNGRAFEQLSSAEQIKISAQIGMSTNPELRVMFIKDGALLDRNSFDAVTKLAEARGYQLWIETIDGHEGAIVLEEGTVKEIREPAAVAG